MTFSIPMRSMTMALCLLALPPPDIAPAAQAANPALQQLPAAETTFKIAGTVVNAITGAPLSQARISITGAKERGRAISVVTSERGNFEFSQLKAGKYSLQGSRRGFISGAYDQHEQFSTAIVTGPRYATDNLILRLTPMAMITGHVSDEYGDPVRNARVALYSQNLLGGMSRISRAGNCLSDDRGYYEFPQLQPGKYFISVSAKPWYAVNAAALNGGANPTSQPAVPSALDVVYPTTYYSGATEADGANAIELNGGDRQKIEMHLNPTSALHLIFRTQEEPGGQQSGVVLEKQVFDSREFEPAEITNRGAAGVYELTGIPPGHYALRLYNGSSGQLLQASEVDLVRDGQELDASRGEPLGSLKLTVKLPGDQAVPKQLVIALQDSRHRLVAFKQADPSGLFSFEDLVPGKYAILVDSGGKAYSVVRTSSASGELIGHEVNITPGAALELSATLNAGAVSIEGVVHKKGQPLAGIMVALVPKDPEAHIELFRRDQSDFDGTFLLRDVVPGAYTIVAVDDAWNFEWRKPGVLERYVQHGQDLTIGELLRGSVNLPDPVEVQPH
jgi:hypothetical protein